MPSAICSIEGCYKLAWSRGLCAMHYQRIKRNGTPDELKRRCKIPKCDELHSAKGLCTKHYMQERQREKMAARGAVPKWQMSEIAALRQDILSYLDDGEFRSNREICDAMEVQDTNLLNQHMAALARADKVVRGTRPYPGSGVRKLTTWRLK